MRKTIVTFVLIFSAAVLSASAQTRIDNPITHKDSDFLFMGKHGMDGKSIEGMGACIATGSPRPPMAGKFERWITDISEVAALKMFNMGRCELMGFRIKDNPGHKWRNVDSFKEYAAGNSMYKVEGTNVVFVKKFAGEIYYIVVAKRAQAHNLEELDVCGPPDIIQRLFKSRKRGKSRVSSSYCHDLKQQIYRVKNPTQYAAHMKRTSAVLFTEKQYNDQKKKGLFRGKAVYTFEGGDTIEPLEG